MEKKLILLLLLIFLLIVVIYQLQRKKLQIAVIVEPRKHSLLIPIVNDMLSKLPKYTKIQIFHGTDNHSFLKNKLHQQIKNKKIVLTNLKLKNMDRNQYSNLLTSKKFWNQIDGEHILIFQTDSCLCQRSNYPWSLYLQYGYVGGPFRTSSDKSNPLPDDIVYQNGGFSLRRKSLMLKAINDKKPGENTWPEDYWFSQTKRDITKPAPYSMAKSFAIEGLYTGQHPLGIHKPWDYLQPKQLNSLRQQCPEIRTIFGK